METRYELYYEFYILQLAKDICEVTQNIGLPILNAWPNWVRFLQCLRRYFGTKKAHPHITNAGKYFSNLLVVLLAFLDKRIFGLSNYF